MKLPQSFLKIIEAAANRYLQSDTQIADHLKKFTEKVVRIHLRKPTTDIYIKLMPTHIEFLNHYEGICEATIYTDIKSLMRAAGKYAHTSSDAEFTKAVEVEGDATLAHDIYRLFSKVDIDWEGMLAKYIGNTPARLMSAAFEKTHQFIDTTIDKLREDSRSFLQDELTIAPTINEVEELYDEIGHLRTDCDRLDARLKRLEAKSKAHLSQGKQQ